MKMNKQEELIKRIDQNFADYRATLPKLDGKDIFGKGGGNRGLYVYAGPPVFDRTSQL